MSRTRFLSSRPVRFAALLVAVAGLSGCPGASGPDLRIVRPAGGLSVTAADFEIEVSSQVDPDSIRIDVNGTALPVSAIQVQTHANGATLTGEMDASTLQPGRFNTLQARGKTLSGQEVQATSNFVWFDGSTPSSVLAGLTAAGSGSASGSGTSTGSTPTGLSGLLGGLLPSPAPGPQLTVTRPTKGEFVPLGETFEIEGTATDPAGVAELMLAMDGQPATSQISYLDPSSGRFLLEARFDEPGLHRFLVTSTNSLGGRSWAKVSVYVGERQPTGAAIEYASQLALTSQGFHSLGKLVEPILTPDVMYRDVPRNSQIWSTRVGPVKAKMWAIGIGHRMLLLDLSVEDGLLHIHADLQTVYLSARVETKAIFVKTTAYVTTTVQRAAYDGWATMTKGANGDVEMAIQRQDVTLSGVGAKVGGLPSSIVKPAVKFAQSYLEDQVRKVLRDQVGTLIAQRLTSFFRVPDRRRVEILDAALLAGGEMGEVRLAADHGRFWTTSTVIAEEAANAIQAPFPGWVSTPNAPGLEIPLENELVVAISDDVLNQTLYEAFRAGATNIDLDKLQNQDELRTITLGVLKSFLGVDVSNLLGLADTVPVTFEVRPMLAPTLVMGYRGEDIIFQAHEVVIDIFLELEGTRQLLFSLLADLDVPLEQIEVDIKTNSIKAQPKNLSVGASGLLPYIDFKLEQMPLVQLPFEVFRPLIVTITQLAMPFLLEILRDPDFAELADLPLVDIHIWGKSDHLFLSGRLDADGRARDNGGPPDYGEGSKENEKKKLAIKFCALVALFGGTPWESLLDPYRQFRDRVLGRDSGPTEAYYRYSFVLPLVLAVRPELRGPVTAAFVGFGLVLALVFSGDGLFACFLVLVVAAAFFRRVRPRFALRTAVV